MGLQELREAPEVDIPRLWKGLVLDGEGDAFLGRSLYVHSNGFSDHFSFGLV